MQLFVLFTFVMYIYAKKKALGVKLLAIIAGVCLLYNLFNGLSGKIVIT